MSVSADAHSAQLKSGVAAAATAYICWGFLPVFWKLLDGIPALELIAQRILWCTITVAGYLLVVNRRRAWHGVEPRIALTLSASALFIAANWWVYVWAVGQGKVVEASLGYFINPLVSVVFGVAFLRERLHPMQWLAVLCAAGGVLYLTLRLGAPPWIALALAFSFACYGLIRKLAPIDAARGLAIEGLWLTLPALGFLWLLHGQGQGHFASDWRVSALMMCSGPITALPLLLFAFGARRIPLSLVGILQYIAPTLQFLAGVFVYREPLTRTQLVGYAAIWLALAVYAADSVYRYARQRRVLAVAATENP